MYQMNLYAIPHLIAFIFCISIGLFVLLKDKKSQVNISFFILQISGSIWQLGTFLDLLAKDISIAIFWSRFVYIGAIFVPISTYHFVVAVLKIKKQEKIVLLSYLIGIFVFLPLSWTNSFMPGLYEYFWGYWFKAGPTHKYFVFFLDVLVILSFYNLFISYRKEKIGLEKNRKKYLLIAFLIAYTGALDFLPCYGIAFYPFSYISLVIYVSIIAYAIVKHRLMNIDIVIKKTLTYSLLLLALLVPCYLFIMLEQKIFFNTVHPLFSISVLLLLILIAFVFPRIKVKTERTVEQILFKKKYDYQHVLTRFSENMVSILELDDLLNDIINTVVRTMDLDKASILLIDKERDNYSIQASYGLGGDLVKDMQMSREDNFIKWLKEKKEIIIKEELDMISLSWVEDVVLKMEWMMSEVCIPLISKGELIGILNLGYKGGGQMYTQEDLDLFSILANQSAISISNAMLLKRERELVKEVVGLNEELKQKVEELINKNRELGNAHKKIVQYEKLAATGKLAAGIAHEINNPLQGMSSSLRMVKDATGNNFTERRSIELVGEGINRIKNIVKQLLDLHHPEHQERTITDVNEVIGQVISLTKKQLDICKIKIKQALSQELPKIQASAQQLHQVFLNIILNAQESMKNGGELEISTEKKDGKISINISDNGEGILEEDMPYIFDPFFSVGKGGGTGLGLSITYEVIRAHDGDITVKSEVGKGTTFTIILPIS